MYLNSFKLTVRRVPSVGIRILTSREQCGDQSVCLKRWTQIKIVDLKCWGIYGVQYVTSPTFEKIDKLMYLSKLTLILSRRYKQLKFSVRIISGCVVGGWREMKIPQCYSNMKLRLGQRKTVWLFISVKLKHAKELTNKVLHLCTCCSCREKNVI